MSNPAINQTPPAVKQYRADATYITTLSAEDIKGLESHGKPAIRKAAELIAYMDSRHQRGEFTPAKDAQDVDSIFFYATASEIRKAIAKVSA